MSSNGTGRRLLVVHAHPDDESIFTGATIAKYAAEGAEVTLVTCTMGERGNARNAAQRGFPPPGEGRMAMLSQLRAKELEAACAELGVTQHYYLGGAGRWLDSGPKDSENPRTFHCAELDEAAGELSAIIDTVQPQVIVTYDANGFYGHPDHIQAHRVAWQAYRQACDPLRTKFYALTIPRSVLARAIDDARQSMHISMLDYRIHDMDSARWSKVCEELAPKFAAVPGLVTMIWLQGEGDTRGGVQLWKDRSAYQAFLESDLAEAIRTHPHIADLATRDYAIDEDPTRITGGPASAPTDHFLRFGSSDDEVSAEIRAEPFLAAKLSALKAHATQITVEGPFFEAAGLVRMRALGTEYYTLLPHPRTENGGSRTPVREDDLFCGL